MSNLDKCKAACCRWLVFGDFPLTRDHIHYYETHGCKVERVARGRYKIRVPVSCPQLGDDNLCRLHGTKQKPTICNRFGEGSTKGYFIPKSCLLK